MTPADRGRVRFQASYWPARLFNGSRWPALAPGEPVEVVGRDGITLLIKPLGRSQETG
ncbi:NfeD family protein [Halomicronema hongdechloris]|uniref:NfeD family protein n=1 Tax=Halomicronema hongdechloris TaxID=1209493 RepID=UPI001CECADD4